MKNRKPLTEEEKKKKREHTKEYRSRPDVIAKQKEKLQDPVYKEVLNERKRVYREKNREKLRADAIKYGLEHKKEKNDYMKEYNRLNRQAISERKKIYRENNKEKIRDFAKEYSQRPEVKERSNSWLKKELKENTQFKLTVSGRIRRWAMLKKQGANKKIKFQESLGCTIEFFKHYIESKFKTGMTWDNWGIGKGKWNLDEIKPCAAFDLSDPEQYKACFHYTNCQPLWSEENLSKGSLYKGVRHSHKNKNIK